MDYIEYEVEVKGIFSLPPKIEFDYPHNYITRIEIEKGKQPHIMTLKLYISKVSDKEQAVEVTKELVTDILNIVSYKFDFHYKEPYPSLIFINGQRSYYVRVSSTVFATAQIIGDYSELLVIGLADKKFLYALKHNPYYHLFRSIMSLDDTISKYAFLYSLLLLIKGSQNAVEGFITTHEPTCEYITRTRTDGKKETKTVYTSLRNMVGHMTKEEEIEDIIKKMDRSMGRLTNLVKIAIEQFSQNEGS